MTASVHQEGGNINLLTAQLFQNFRLGPLNWENIITYQNSSSPDVLPLPALNIFSNLYLKFKIARVLDVELGGNVTYFTKYEAYHIDQIIDGETVEEVLEYVQYNPKKLVRQLEVWVAKSVKQGKITLEEGKEFLSNYRSGLYGYTYLE